jgi:phosphoribosylanthranilate isomerase
VNIIIKMCGNRSHEDLVNATKSGADLLGIIFADAWRKIAVEDAKMILDKFRNSIELPPQIVGVFVNQPIDEVNKTALDLDLDMVQLHGEEDQVYWDKIKKPLIIAKRVQLNANNDQIDQLLIPVLEYTEKMDYICLVEPYSKNHLGGAGVSLNLNTAEKISGKFPVLMAGGLNPNNVSDVIKSVKPWGVDVSSGVESNNIKDPEKVARFIYEARKASTSITR